MMAALTCHNLPEGLAVAVSAHTNPTKGLAVACAIALHNIPEGLVIAVPAFAATGSAGRALLLTLLSGLSEVPPCHRRSVVVREYAANAESHPPPRAANASPSISIFTAVIAHSRSARSSGLSSCGRYSYGPTMSRASRRSSPV